jgi:hypothetical protein
MVLVRFRSRRSDVTHCNRWGAPEHRQPLGRRRPAGADGRRELLDRSPVVGAGVRRHERDVDIAHQRGEAAMGQAVEDVHRRDAAARRGIGNAAHDRQRSRVAVAVPHLSIVPGAAPGRKQADRRWSHASTAEAPRPRQTDRAILGKMTVQGSAD